MAKKILAVGKHFRGGICIGDIEILGSTNHGKTSVISVSPFSELNNGDLIKLKKLVLRSKNLIVCGPHKKPIRFPGRWYEVRSVTPAEIVNDPSQM